MTQVSLPQAGDGVGDSGPYTSDDWARLFEVVFTGDQAATQGVLRNHLNELEVTLSGNTISIDTGAGFCYGHWLENDASVDINVTACAGVETRWDRVVLVQNETAAAYNTNLLLPAAYAAGVPRNSCRIAILRGTCATPGVLPALLTGPSYYMVELARYQVTGGSAGTVTDYRDYCEFSTLLNADSIENRTRRFWIPAQAGTSADNGPLYPIEGPVVGPGIEMLNNDVTEVWGMGIIPSDYDTTANSMTVQAVIVAFPTGGSIYGFNSYSLGSCGTEIQSQSQWIGYVAEATDSNPDPLAWSYSCMFEIVNTMVIDPTADFVSCGFVRLATHALDTSEYAAYFRGWIMEYIADG